MIIYMICVLFANSRGWLELLLSKKPAYLIQGLALGVAVIALIWGMHKSEIFSRQFSFVITCTLTLASTSLAYTFFCQAVDPLQALAVYSVNSINICFLIAAIAISQSSDHGILTSQVSTLVSNLIFILTSLVILTGILQSLGLLDLPGDANFGAYKRLSGPHGSKQHYSIALAILTIVTFLAATKTSSKLGWVIFLSATLTLLAALTRIGYVIFAIGLLVPLGFRMLTNIAAGSLKPIITALVITIILAGLALSFEKPASVFLDRLSTFTISDNSKRIESWEKGLDSFEGLSLYIVSEKLGSASQIPGALLGIDTPHYESGHVQYLVNFGFAFWVWVLVLFFYWSFSSKDLIGFFFPISILISLSFYMANEIVPCFIMLPLFSLANNHLKHRQHRNHRISNET